jgi:hypothetical protein
MTSLPAAASSLDCRRCSHPDCRATSDPSVASNTRCDTSDWHSIDSGSFGGNRRHPRKGVLNLGIGWPKTAYFWRFFRQFLEGYDSTGVEVCVASHVASGCVWLSGCQTIRCSCPATSITRQSASAAGKRSVGWSSGAATSPYRKSCRQRLNAMRLRPKRRF